jgi:hypothetical protein
MMNKSKLVLVAAVAVLGATSSALAKSSPAHHAYPDRLRVARSAATAYPQTYGRQSGLHSFATVPGSSDFQMQLRMDHEDF